MISIIIPVLNEQEQIIKTINHLRVNSQKDNVKEIIIVDGGSTDNTLLLLSKYKDCTVLISEKGRAKQLNFGANFATGKVLYFLHCDSLPPKNFDQLIVEAVSKEYLSGCFRMRFDSNHLLLKISQWFTRFNVKYFRGGDQSLFVTKELFDEISGFNEKYTVYEDNELIYRLYEKSNFKVIQKDITTSSRRYKQNGTWKLQFHFMIIHLLYHLKIYNQDQVLKYYRRNIK
ncbi:Glycosyl transferase family 2 [Flavobacterium sp. 9AF]|uniref:TIGR04283 family arsenosugar biosynthesis glycosyltransferase n=1 Tax=Flavobacterium sp. 9AF TaxID=2653142 RepID=UPI0012F15B2D|nr:TIGR04283 family arsenosugar biosynthesis glycosyltransferase [Flavobacterium sp. 9AF]VXA93047.1 Glycosyl transferase family 2 [Flavobacterium sp. 9AF]